VVSDVPQGKPAQPSEAGQRVTNLKEVSVRSPAAIPKDLTATKGEQIYANNAALA
jgi:hypothetical protein